MLDIVIHYSYVWNLSQYVHLAMIAQFGGDEYNYSLYQVLYVIVLRRTTIYGYRALS
jgi:hypothetical protein